MSYTHALSADETTGSPVASDLLVAIDQRTQAMQKAQEDADRWRKWSTLIAAASALFAAGKLGILAIPHVKAMRQQRLGSLAGPTSNPARRRRRRR